MSGQFAGNTHYSTRPACNGAGWLCEACNSDSVIATRNAHSTWAALKDRLQIYPEPDRL